MTKPLVVLDTETFLSQPGRMAPRVVCVSVRHPGGERELLRPGDPKVRGVLEGAKEKYHLGGHFIAYDMACLAATDPQLLPLIFDLYLNSRIVCSRLAYKLWLLERGELAEDGEGGNKRRPPGFFSLDSMAQSLLRHAPMDKGADGWRLRYGTLDATPLDQWPQRARDYALDDVVAPFELLQHLGWEDFPDLPRQAAYDFSLYLMAAWGLRTSAEACAELRTKWQATLDSAAKAVTALGIFRENGTRDMKRLQAAVAEAWRAAGVPAEQWERTPKGALATSKDTLLALAHKAQTPALKAYTVWSHAQKALNTFLPVFEAGRTLPIHPRVDVLKATGRVSQSKPNLQQLPNEPGFREVFVPREGNVFLAVDLDTAEVRAYGQSLLDELGYSTIAEGYQRDPQWDPHCDTGAEIEGEGRTYEDALANKKSKEFKAYRNMAKGANFGLPGGMGAKRLVDYIRGYGVTITVEQAWGIKNAYARKYPETQVLQERVARALELGGGEVMTETPRTKRRRLCKGSRAYCQANNSRFQPIVADITKLAALWLTHAQYVEGVDADLYGTRLVNMVHDELVLEASRATYRAVAKKVEDLIKKAARTICPDVPFECSATAMARLQKADPLCNEEGDLEVIP